MQISTLTKEQFDSNVKRSLHQVAGELEELEATKYLNKELENGSARSSKLSDTSGDTNGNDTSAIDTASLSVKPLSMSRHSSIKEASKMYQNRMAEDFARSRQLIDIVAWRKMAGATTRDLSQRVDQEELARLLRKTFTDNDIDEPYYFKVVDQRNKEIFSSADTSGEELRHEYAQRLFQNDAPNGNTGTLYVYFPETKSMIRSSTRLLIQWAILSFILLVSCIASIVLIFRQRRLSEIKNDFVSNMTHELKTPVSTISLAAQMLSDPTVAKTDDTLKYYTRVIVDETKRLKIHIEKVLQMSTFERGGGNLRLTECDVNDLLKMILENFWVKVHAKHGQLISELQAKNALVLADEAHFTNVLYNLMDNAVKYTPNNLVLTVKTWNDKGNLCISIQDNGIGIKKEHQKRIFDKFFRVPTGNIHNVKGFGLGLAYVKQIIDAHQGTIKVESEINIGTKFIITLPTLKID